MHPLFGRIWKGLAQERGDAGVGTIAVITATIVAGSAVAAVVIEVDTEAAAELQQVVTQSFDRVTNTLELRGGVVVADDDGDGLLDTVNFPVALGPGGDAVALADEDGAPLLVVNLLAGGRWTAGMDYSVSWPRGEGPGLEHGDLAEITVSLPDSLSIGRGAVFQLEIIGQAGGTLVIERSVPATFDRVAYLH